MRKSYGLLITLMIVLTFGSGQADAASVQTPRNLYYVDLWEKGVKCDGTTDDGAAIRAAIAASVANAVIQFPSGTGDCMASSATAGQPAVIWKPDRTYRGASDRQTVIRQTSGNNSFAFTASEDWNNGATTAGLSFVLENIWINGDKANNTATYGPCLVLSNGNARISNVTPQNCAGDGVKPEQRTKRQSGTSTSTGAGTLTQTGAGWTVNAYSGMTLFDAYAQEYAIASNTATILTVTGSGSISGSTTPQGGNFWIGSAVSGNIVEVRLEGLRVITPRGACINIPGTKHSDGFLTDLVCQTPGLIDLTVAAVEISSCIGWAIDNPHIYASPGTMLRCSSGSSSRIVAPYLEGWGSSATNGTYSALALGSIVGETSTTKSFSGVVVTGGTIRNPNYVSGSTLRAISAGAGTSQTNAMLNIIGTNIRMQPDDIVFQTGNGAGGSLILNVVGTQVYGARTLFELGGSTFHQISGNNFQKQPIEIFPAIVTTVISGNHTGAANASVLTDGTKSWTTNVFVGPGSYFLYNTTDGSYCPIQSNTSTTITCPLERGTENDWDAAAGGDAYEVRWYAGTIPYGTEFDNSQVTSTSTPRWKCTTSGCTATSHYTAFPALGNADFDTSAELDTIVTDDTGSGALVFGTSPQFTTSLELPNAAAPTVDAFGEIAGDNNIWASGRGAPIWWDGTALTVLLGTLASDTPTNGQSPVWNTGGTITWETPSSTGLTTIKNEGSSLTQRAIVDFIGGSINCVDDGSAETDCTVSSIPAGYVNVKDYSADGSDTQTTIATTAHTCGTTALVVADSSTFQVGEGIMLADGGAAGVTFVDTVAAVADSTHITLTNVTACTGTLAVTTTVVYHDDTAAINAALSVGGGNTNVYVPAGIYNITSAIDFDATGQRLYGDGCCGGGLRLTKIQNRGTANDMFTLDKSGIRMSDLMIAQATSGEGSVPTAGTAFLIGDNTTVINQVQLDHVYVVGTYDGMKVQVVSQSVFSNMWIASNVRYGIYYSNPNPNGDNRFTNIYMAAACATEGCNTATGIFIDQGDLTWWTNVKVQSFSIAMTINPGASQAVYNQRFIGSSFENSGGADGSVMINIQTTSTGIVRWIQFLGGSIGNTGPAVFNGMQIAPDGSDVKGVSIVGVSFDNILRHGLLLTDAQEVSVVGNVFYNVGIDADNTYNYIHFAASSSAADIVISGNTFFNDNANHAARIVHCASNPTRLTFSNNQFNPAIGTGVDTAIHSCGTATGFVTEIQGRQEFDGTAPAVSACGTTPAIVGNDHAGKVTVGTGSTTSCTVTFNVPYENAPACVITSNQSATIAHATATTTTVLTITSGTSMASGIISYICDGYH